MIDLSGWGYAPGYYPVRCTDCGGRITADRHSWRCRDDAKAALIRAMDSPDIEIVAVTVRYVSGIKET